MQITIKTQKSVSTIQSHRSSRFAFFDLARSLVIAGTLVAATSALAQLRIFTGYNSRFLDRNDDLSSGPANLGFSGNFFGTTRSQIFVNNNGNLTFDAQLPAYIESGIANANAVIIAPYFSDVDTRSPRSNGVTYGSGVLGGHNAFAANWFGVGVFNEVNIFNTFQVVLVDRSDIAAGDFDFEFNYTALNWDTGDFQGGVQGRGGVPGESAHVGYSSGGATPAWFELAGSGISGSFLDDNTVTGLIYNHLGTAFDGAAVDGRYVFNVRDGLVVVTEPPVSAVPEPSTYGLFGAATLLGLLMARRLWKPAV